MSNQLSRKPVIMIEENHELLKSQTGTASPGPGWAGQRHGDPGIEQHQVGTVPAGVQPSYRTPGDRVLGNVMFRRYPGGELDVANAAHQVIDAIHRVKDMGGADQLNSLEKTALSVLFPQSFFYVDASMVSSVARVQLRLAPHEVEQVRMAVAAHLAEEMNWNAGFGGGSVPGRSTTKE